jgi:starch synthase (maltosyl-transferring)
MPPPRVVIETLQPSVDDGRYPIKRTAGDEIVVTADVFADGHDKVAAVLKWREIPHGKAPSEWRETPMTPLGNDAWTARFRVERIGRAEYTVEAWIDRLATLRDTISKKLAAGQDVALERIEEAELAPSDARADTVTFEPARVALVERERARFGAWYEMFPRSYSPDPTRSATFDEAARRLPGIVEMGFDVLYLPPIHPIGRTFRRGRNNAPAAGPHDPGSPWAIGAAEGGHTAVEPGLGALADFDRFVATARRIGLEIALDLAYQTSPDHPYVNAHPEWFRRRPDGTIRYAENPPKKYQDIYPFDFESPDWRALWEELKDIVFFWIGHGVKIFRVDNPHTKPFAFWDWLIGDVRAAHPDVIFLSEAFTRPKVMRHLAKLGFSQSYTYFTWRITKAELTEYFTELTQTEVREYLRPNLFANTPDILHAYLQQGGPAAFAARLVLAATLGASYGVYSGFEVCEDRAAAPGSEEYLNSEKYEFRYWDWEQPGHIRDLIARVNRIRREHPALHRDWSPSTPLGAGSSTPLGAGPSTPLGAGPSTPLGAGLRFHLTDNDQIICYSKVTPDRSDVLLVVVNLDPRHMQHGRIQVPVAHLALPDAYEVRDLLTGETYAWRGEWNYVRLDPPSRMAHILEVKPQR